MPAKSKRDLFNEGYDAGERGEPETANPYKAGSRESAAWNEGWDHGSADYQPETARHAK